MPDMDKEGCRGRHAQCLYGYDNEKQAFLSQKSWGQWGINGFSWIPYKYIWYELGDMFCRRHCPSAALQGPDPYWRTIVSCVAAQLAPLS